MPFDSSTIIEAPRRPLAVDCLPTPISVPGMECLNPGRLDRRPPRELFEGARLCNRVPSGHRAANPGSTASMVWIYPTLEAEHDLLRRTKP